MPVYRKPLSDVHPDWRRPYPINWPGDWTSRDGVEVSCGADSVTVTWDEPSDDHYGTSTRSVFVPRAVMLAALGVPDVR